MKIWKKSPPAQEHSSSLEASVSQQPGTTIPGIKPITSRLESIASESLSASAGISGGPANSNQLTPDRRRPVDTRDLGGCNTAERDHHERDRHDQKNLRDHQDWHQRSECSEHRPYRGDTPKSTRDVKINTINISITSLTTVGTTVHYHTGGTSARGKYGVNKPLYDQVVCLTLLLLVLCKIIRQ